jgi:hypothetical protein
MTFRLNVDPQLPAEQQPLIQRLRDLWRQVALVTRELQAPPIMHVRRTGNQAIAAGVPEKIEFDSVRYDTHGYWDATHFRWKPLRTGYYLLQWSLAFSAGASADNSCFATLYSGGSGDRAANAINPTTSAQITACNSAVIFADGSASYFEVWALSSQDCNVLGDQIYSYFCAAYLGDNQLR